jgi:hypothetical protein
MEKSLVVCLLPVEEDTRFVRRFETDEDRVGERFDVIRHYLLILVNDGRRELLIRGRHPLAPGGHYVIEKYDFSKFDWFTSFRIPFRRGRRRFQMVFEVPDHIPDEAAYQIIPGLGKKAYRLPVRVVRGSGRAGH